MKKIKNKDAQKLVNLRWAKTTPTQRKLVSVKLHKAKKLKKLSTEKVAIVRKVK